jgi:hypothetical protein
MIGLKDLAGFSATDDIILYRQGYYATIKSCASFSANRMLWEVMGGYGLGLHKAK